MREKREILIQSDHKTVNTSEPSVLLLQETQFKADHQKLERTIVMVHHLSIIAGVLGILFTILGYAVILCIIFDSISVLSAIFAVFSDRKQKKECEEIRDSF